MENVTLRAHFDGRQIVLDEPFELAPGAELIITVLPGPDGAGRGGRGQIPPDDSVPAGGGRARGHSPQDSPGFNAPTQPAGRRVVFNRVAIRDPEVNNIEGATLLLPEGWRLEGGFVWMPTFSIQANLLVRASEPQTGAAVQTLSLQNYVWPLMQTAVPMQIGQNWLGSVVMPPPRNAVEFVQNVYLQGPLQHLRGARLEGVEDMPQLAAELLRLQGGWGTVYVSRLRYAYEFGGRGWEEEVNVTLKFAPPDGVAMWEGSGHAMRAPAGELERMRPLLAVPVQTMRITLDWSATLDYVRQLYRQGRADQMQRTRDWGRQLAAHRDEMRRVHQQAYEAQQASQDRINFARREVLGGVQTFVNPFESRTVELPAGYRHNWVSDDGQVICTDDGMFDPQQGDRRTWQDMARYRP